MHHVRRSHRYFSTFTLSKNKQRQTYCLALNAAYTCTCLPLPACLSFSVRHTQPPEPWSFYSTLRSINPAPYSAWLSVAASAAAPGITVCCSSPERFLSCGRGGVLEAKPIKGTARRHLHDPAADWASAAALLASEKERAENLMIVDLLRNDLGR